jgi:serine protease AprX
MQAVLTRGLANPLAPGAAWRPGFGLSHGFRDSGTAKLVAVLLGILLLGSSAAAVGRASFNDVIVRSQPGANAASMELVRQLGGDVLLELGIIDGFSARVPSGALPRLLEHDSIHSVTPDSTLELHGRSDDYDPVRHAGSMYNLTRSIKRRLLLAARHHGPGVDVALIDTGVAPVNGLTQGQGP